MLSRNATSRSRRDVVADGADPALHRWRSRLMCLASPSDRGLARDRRHKISGWRRLESYTGGMIPGENITGAAIIKST